ncbi:Sister chromatid cohesion 1 protein 4 [Linum perenne]
MFYSQFILAKKGPLGTIWIAAHLERKLRKNQVADTDIGFSVDSILSPDVPIALRLSSHLLVGVVRIYSRKVNYLFDDCSEALLKIKQAFRSTAVDLPPEESTAPYNSITLPETFDLDDFELPDNDILQGNYVDHHISSKEQITLQDSVEGVVYTTSQFGLDERFGDGDTSQVGLDLEEDLFLDKAAASGTNGISVVDHDMSIEAAEDPERDENDHRAARLSESLPVNYSENKIEDRTSNAELIEYAQAPSTPVLVQEPNLSSVQHGLVCDDHLESEDHNSADIHGVESTENVSSKTDHRHKDEGIVSSAGDRIQCLEAEQDIFLASDLTVNEAKLDGALCSTPVSMEYMQEDGTIGALQDANKDEKNDVVGRDGQPTQLLESTDEKCKESSGARLLESGDADVSRDVEGHLLQTFCASDLPPAPGHAYIENQGQVSLNINTDSRNMSSSPSMVGLEMCNSSLNGSIVQPDIRSIPSSTDPSNTEDVPCLHGNFTEIQGADTHLVNSTMVENAQNVQPGLEGEIMDESLRLDDSLENEIPKNDHSENLNDLPEPEKMLYVPEKLLDGPDQYLGSLTPVSEFLESGNGVSIDNRVSGRKRSFTESTLNTGDINSAESLGQSKSQRTQETIPDDDDLLTSILVGRKSSVLKLKPSPPAPEVKTAKRSRPTSRLSALKRKVLMDETMVLHGDTIRQQLTNTEDIRRLRKKAPCTRIEILMIQRQHLEDQIFNEPVFTGMVKELACLHNGAIDSSGIRIIKRDAFSEMGMDVERAATLINQYGSLEKDAETVDCREVNDEQPIGLHVLSEDLRCEDQPLGASGVGSEKQQESDALNAEEMGIDKVNAEDTDALIGSETTHVEHVCLHKSDDPHMPSVNSIEDASEETNPLNQTSDKTDIELIQDETCLKDMNDIKLSNEVEELGHTEVDTVTVRTELIPEELLMEECKDGPAIQISVNKADCEAPSEPHVNTTWDTIGCMDLPLGNDKQSHEGIENGEVGLGSEEEVGATGLELIVKDKSSSLYSEELKMDLVHSAEHDAVVSQDANHQTTIDGDRPAVGDQCDFPDVVFANDTEFLNVDDDEMDEEDDNDMPSVEDTRILDNSGWSSRTRAVAKYLQTLFDGEAGQERKVISMENLLAGKTRKEASRMFFETLVLKTRDYIQVEQGKPFENINIKPRVKLMKSEF